MFAKTQDELDAIYLTLDKVKKLSDRIIGIGPINIIGLDGILGFIPIVGTVYSVGAGLVILGLGLRGRASLGTLFTALLILIIDSGIATIDDIVLFFPPAAMFLGFITGGADAIFQGHLYAAHLIQKEMDQTLFVDESERLARKESRHKGYMAEVKATKGKKRLVYLRG